MARPCGRLGSKLGLELLPAAELSQRDGAQPQIPAKRGPCRLLVVPRLAEAICLGQRVLVRPSWLRTTPRQEVAITR